MEQCSIPHQIGSILPEYNLQQDPEQILDQLLQQLSIPPHIKGYADLREAVLVSLEKRL